MAEDLFNTLFNITKNNLPNDDKPESLLKSILQITTDVVNEYTTDNDTLAKEIKNTVDLATSMIDLMGNNDISEEDTTIRISENIKSCLNIANNCINGYYNENLDIIKIHEHIVNYFKECKESNLYELYEELKKYDINNKIPRNLKLYIEEEKNKILEKIRDIENDVTLNEYIEKVIEIIDEFKNLDNNCSTTYKLQLIIDFINVAKNYYNIQLNLNKDDIQYCFSCGEIVKDDECYYCGITISYMKSVSNAIAETGYSNISKNTYTHDINFGRFISRILCINNDSITNDNINQIRYYFDSYYNKNVVENITCEEICQLTPDKDGRKGPYKIKDIYNVLHILKLSQHDPDAHYIAHVIWNWQLPDASMYETIMMDREHVNSIYQTIKHKYQQNSNLNNWYLSYRLLEKNGTSACYVSDFKLFKTIKTLYKYENMWEEICKLANYPKPVPININEIN